MQKKIIALAIAGLSASAAFAADTVTIYGRMDYGFVNKSGNGGAVTGVDSKNSFGSGVQAGSRIGFKGAEDLGNGLKAIFETEFHVGVDAPAATGSTAATWLNRHSYVGLTGGFGTVVGGRLDGVRYGLFNKYDAFAGGTVGNFTQMTAQVDRADNAIAYISPSFNGLTATLAYSSNIAGQEAAGNHGDAVLNTFMLNYANGPIDVSADFERVQTAKVTLATGDSTTKVATLAGSYDFGVVKLAALWDSHKVDNNVTALKTTDYRDWFISALAPVTGTAATVKATYGKVTNKLADNKDANKFALGVDYALSKRTNIYVDYAKISNDSAAAFQVSTAANANGTNGVQGFDIGIAHKF